MAKRLEKRHPLAIRWFHWIHFPVLALLVWSGLLIYWANDVYALRIGNWTVFKFFPEPFYKALNLEFGLAKGLYWHFFAMWFFTVNGLLYVIFLALSGQWRHVLPRRGALKEAWLVTLHDLRLYRGPLPERKYNGAQQIAYTLVIVMGAGSLVTGLAIYRPIQLSWLTAMLGGYDVSRFLHFWLMIGFLLFFLIHVIQVVRAGWNNFRAMVTGWALVEEKEAA